MHKDFCAIFKEIYNHIASRHLSTVNNILSTIKENPPSIVITSNIPTRWVTLKGEFMLPTQKPCQGYVMNDPTKNRSGKPYDKLVTGTKVIEICPCFQMSLLLPELW